MGTGKLSGKSNEMLGGGGGGKIVVHWHPIRREVIKIPRQPMPRKLGLASPG